MLFVELRFFVFFLLVFGIYWALGNNRSRKIWLLAASYVFYGAWDWRFLSLILLSTGLDYIAGLRLGSVASPASRRLWAAASVAGNLSILGFFKYFNFFTESLVDLAGLAGVTLSHTTLQIVLPVGISFYTFQTMSYSLDIYFGKLRPTKNLLDLALFVAFFPQLVAGPIVRARDFLPQLETPRRFPLSRARGFLVLFLVGFFKKACISDNLAPFVDQYFAAPAAFDASSSWVAVLFYSIQIYCDFSGYSDMAIACAGLLGFHLMDNFAAPYFASSITEFWRRWHISLSTWLRDYLYIPLGGNRGGNLFIYRNLMLTMLLGGLWHGASWNFVIWGGLHGAALILHKEWTRVAYAPAPARVLTSLLGPVITFYWVCVTWIFFRAVDLADSGTILGSFVLLRSPGAEQLEVPATVIFLSLAALHWIARGGAVRRWWEKAPAPLFAVLYGVLFALAVTLVPMDHRPFIYFQF